MSVPAKTTEYWVGELANLVTEHVARTKEAITRLEDRIIDLEGHAEHGPAGTCGVCAPEPETVGADVYVLSTVRLADFEGECGDPFCSTSIRHGDDVIQRQGKWVHNDCG